MDFFRPSNISFCGDYGDIVLDGMVDHLPRTDEGLVQLERSGPLMPAITFPSSKVLVSDEARVKLSEQRIHLEFRPVVKAHIARLPWATLDDAETQLAHELANLAIGSPASLILDRKHCPRTSRELGDVWELVPPLGPSLSLIHI